MLEFQGKNNTYIPGNPAHIPRFTSHTVVMKPKRSGWWVMYVKLFQMIFLRNSFLSCVIKKGETSVQQDHILIVHTKNNTVLRWLYPISGPRTGKSTLHHDCGTTNLFNGQLSCPLSAKKWNSHSFLNKETLKSKSAWLGLSFYVSAPLSCFIQNY